MSTLMKKRDSVKTEQSENVQLFYIKRKNKHAKQISGEFKWKVYVWVWRLGYGFYFILLYRMSLTLCSCCH